MAEIFLKYVVQATNMERLMKSVECPVCTGHMVGRFLQPQVCDLRVCWKFDHWSLMLLQVCSVCAKSICAVCSTKVPLLFHITWKIRVYITSGQQLPPLYDFKGPDGLGEVWLCQTSNILNPHASCSAVSIKGRSSLRIKVGISHHITPQERDCWDERRHSARHGGGENECKVRMINPPFLVG